MGHYLSELGGDEDDRRKTYEELKNKQLIEALQRGIDRGELAKILAQIVANTAYPGLSKTIFLNWYKK